MGISGIGHVNTYTYKNVNRSNNPNKGTALFDRVGAATASNPHRVSGQSRLTVYGAYCSMSSRAGHKISFSNLGVQVSGNLDAVENDKYAISVYTEEGVKGHWRVYNKETGTTMSFDPKLTSMQIDPETGKKYLTETDWLGGFMGAWGVDSSLEELLGKFMGVDDLQCSDINENFTLDRDKTTGIVSIKRKGAEGNGASMIIEDEEQEKKLEELADLYLEKYPSLVTTREMALHFAKYEIMGFHVRDETGVLSIGTGGMVYYNAQDPTKSWGILYSGYDSSIYSKMKEAFVSGSITGNLISDYKKWVEWLTEKKIDFELTTAEEDLERLREENYSEWLRITSSLRNVSGGILKLWDSCNTDNTDGEKAGETRNETNIIVKPDGSRVLVVTMNIGGMETTMSIKISEPTDIQNDGSFPNNNTQQGNNISSMISEEMSDK